MFTRVSSLPVSINKRKEENPKTNRANLYVAPANFNWCSKQQHENNEIDSGLPISSLYMLGAVCLYLGYVETVKPADKLRLSQ